jgi:MFS family permease
MAKSPWIPLTLGLGILVLGTALIIFIPETTHLRSSEAEELILDPSSDQTGSSKKIKSGFVAVTVTQISDGFKRIHDASTVLHSLPILMLIFSFVTAPVVNQSMDLALRYISKRFSWELRQTGLLVSLRALVNILVLLLIIPSLSSYMTERLHYSSQARDLSLARCSAVMLFVGALTFAASPTIVLTILGMVICTLGGGFVFLTRSLITTLVDKEHVARLYAAIAIVEIVSSIAAGPSIAALFAVGLKLKGPWLALPFYALALVCFVSGIGVWCFRLPTQKREDIPCGDGDHQTLSGSDVFLPKNTAEGRVLDHV